MKRFLGFFVFLYILLLDVSLGYSVWVGDFYIDGVDAGKSVTVTAPKKAGYDFSRWEVSLGDITLGSPTSNPMIISMPSQDIGIYPTYVETTINTSPYGTNLGDINLDNTISMSDVALLSSYLDRTTTLTAEQLLRADVNSDGKINGFDMVLLSAFVNRYINEWPLNIKCGDVTLDGNINSGDSQQLIRYLGGYRELSTKQLLAADVNLDGAVDKFDAKLIAAYCIGKIPELPSDLKCGDLNGDGIVSAKDEKIIRKYVVGTKTLTANQQLCADVNLDGKVDKLDVALILCFRAGYIRSLPVDFLYGDVDGNGVVTSADDALLVLDENDRVVSLSDDQLIRADVNFDGVVDETDALLIHEYYLGNVPVIPVGPMYGDVTGDGEVRTIDAAWINMHISGDRDFSQAQKVSADVNLDDVIDQTDLDLIQSYILTGVPALPVLDGGDEFNFIWDTTGQLEKSIKVKTNGTTTIDWGDGSTDSIASSPDVELTLTHTYASAGNYTVKILDDVVTSLKCTGSQISDLDVSNATALMSLECQNNQLTSLDVSNNTALTLLRLQSNQLTSLDVSNNRELTLLNCGGNILTSLDITHNTALVNFACHSNQLTSLDLSENLQLRTLYCAGNQLTSLDLVNNTALRIIECQTNQLTELNVSNCTLLSRLLCYTNQLTELNVSNCTLLDLFSCTHNQLTSLDISNNVVLKQFNCSNNSITNLDVSNNTELTVLKCNYNQITSLDVSNNTALDLLWCTNNQLTSLDVSHNTLLEELCCNNNSLPNIDVSHNTVLRVLKCQDNNLTSVDVSNNLVLTELQTKVAKLITDSRQNIVTLNRAATTRMVTITQTPHGRIEYAGGYKFNIIPDAGYAIASLTAGGVSQTVTGTYDFGSLSADKTLTATFTPIGVGSYVAYSAGGYTGDWVVLRNSTGQLEIISKESVGDVTLGGADDYANAVSILNSKAKEYINYNYAVSARSVGATVDSIEQIDTTQYPLTYEAASTAGQVLPYHDTYYTDDQSLISGNANLKHSSGEVWLGSRYLYPDGNVYVFCINSLMANGTLSNEEIFYMNSSNSPLDGGCAHGVRPVVTLRGDLRVIGGSGTQADPYVLGIPHESVAVGSYISYTGGTYEGDWVVLRDTPVGLEIISKESVGDITLSGASGYASAVATLNAKSQLYVNPSYAVAGRSVGATANSIGIIDTVVNPITHAAANAAGEVVPYHDTYYTDDQSLISGNANLKHSSGEVWIASRILGTNSGSSKFLLRILDSSGTDNFNILFYMTPFGGDGTSSEGTNGVRPVITLRGNVKTTGGSGTQGNPYTIGL